MSLTAVFQKAFPYYLKMGMTYEQFWEGPTDAHRAFREAEKLRMREQNQLLWLHGRYVYDALIAVTPYLKAFSKAKPRPYLTEPYDIDEESKRKREEREARERYEHIRANVAVFAKAFNERQHEKTTEKEVKGNG